MPNLIAYFGKKVSFSSKSSMLREHVNGVPAVRNAAAPKAKEADRLASYRRHSRRNPRPGSAQDSGQRVEAREDRVASSVKRRLRGLHGWPP